VLIGTKHEVTVMATDEGSARTYRLDLTPAELRITRAALQSFLNDFGHDERDVQAQVRAVLRKLPDDALERSAS
jgi:hypothetical protein